MLSNWRDDPFDVQSSNSELCLGLRRNAVYFTTEILLPALITSIITISSMLFQLSTVQPMLIALSVLAQIIALTLINTRLPTFAIHTPTIRSFHFLLEIKVSQRICVISILITSEGNEYV